jgi:hypothetical protein
VPRPTSSSRDQTVCRVVAKDARAFGHFDVECTFAVREPVLRADAGENAVDDWQRRRRRRDERSCLRHNLHNADLPYVRALARHIGAGDDREVAVSCC